MGLQAYVMFGLQIIKQTQHTNNIVFGALKFFQMFMNSRTGTFFQFTREIWLKNPIISDNFTFDR